MARLKPGIKVMVTKNISQLVGGVRKLIPNGTTAKLLEINNSGATLLCDGTNDRFTIKYQPHRLYFKSGKHTKQQASLVSCYATVAYYPLACSFACTIHKSQGLTLHRVIIDMGTYRYNNLLHSTLLYVALSRCTSLAGIYFKHHFDVKVMQGNAACVAVFRYLIGKSREVEGRPFELL
jgi:ATP-dependent exoDNAse (exonuclease V) alpha subunit